MSKRDTCEKFTPPQIARRFGVAQAKVIAWIESGELGAINAATKPNGRPRYRIDKRDVIAFERRRAVTPSEIEFV